LDQINKKLTKRYTQEEDEPKTTEPALKSIAGGSGNLGSGIDLTQSEGDDAPDSASDEFSESLQRARLLLRGLNGTPPTEIQRSDESRPEETPVKDGTRTTAVPIVTATPRSEERRERIQGLDIDIDSFSPVLPSRRDASVHDLPEETTDDFLEMLQAKQRHVVVESSDDGSEADDDYITRQFQRYQEEGDEDEVDDASVVAPRPLNNVSCFNFKNAFDDTVLSQRSDLDGSHNQENGMLFNQSLGVIFQPREYQPKDGVKSDDRGVNLESRGQSRRLEYQQEQMDQEADREQETLEENRGATNLTLESAVVGARSGNVDLPPVSISGVDHLTESDVDESLEESGLEDERRMRQEDVSGEDGEEEQPDGSIEEESDSDHQADDGEGREADDSVEDEEQEIQVYFKVCLNVVLHTGMRNLIMPML
jgi:hypothetical protein